MSLSQLKVKTVKHAAVSDVRKIETRSTIESHWRVPDKPESLNMFLS